MITVWPSGTTTTVSAIRELITGPSAPPEIGTHWLRSARPEDSGVTIISTNPSEVLNGVLVTSGTSWPRLIVACWLLRVRIDGRDRISLLPAVAIALNVA